MTRSTPRAERGRRAAGTPRAARTARSTGSRRPLDLTFVLALVLPLLVALALFLTNPGFGSAYFHPPTRPQLTRATAVCPAALGKGDTIGVASGGSGGVSLTAQPAGGTSGATSEAKDATVPADGVGTARVGTDPVLITAADGAAPGLVATRSSSEPVAAATCGSPRANQWFTGLGAGPTHDSFVVLVNPNPGPAIADLTVLGDTGPIQVPALRGIAVPGHASQEIDLGAVMPTQSPVALHAAVERGQVAVSVRDRAAHLIGDATDEDWVPAQARPSRRALLLGLPTGTGSRQLTVANPSDREVSATVRLVTANSSFAPENAPTIDIGPQSVTRVDLAHVLGPVGAKGTLGVQVVATGAVTASLRSVIDHDVSIAAPSQRNRVATGAVVPTGPKQLVVGGASGTGALTVVARDANGKKLSSQRIAVAPRQAVAVALPNGAVRIDVTPERTAFRGSVTISPQGGTAVVPLGRLRTTSTVPFVKPGLPH